MTLPIRIDKGICRLASKIKVESGKWYYGFICKNCGRKIFSLDNPNQDPLSQPAVGEGKFSIPCSNCMTDEIIYESQEFIPVQADSDGTQETAFPRCNPSNRPRQPLTNRYPKAKPTFGTRFIEDRPKCAIIIARCVSIWSYIDSELALLLSVILKINTEPAMAMYLAIQNSKIQADVLKAAAETILDKNDFELFVVIVKIKSRFEKARNDLVHGLIGGSNLVSEGILWIEPRYLTEHTARVWASDYVDLDNNRVIKNTFVYEPEDLETVANNSEWLHKIISAFRGYISSDNESWRIERYRQFCAEPHILQELSLLRDSKKNNR